MSAIDTITAQYTALVEPTKSNAFSAVSTIYNDVMKNADKLSFLTPPTYTKPAAVTLAENAAYQQQVNTGRQGVSQSFAPVNLATYYTPEGQIDTAKTVSLPEVSFSNVGTSFMGNQNPSVQGGVAKVNIGGQVLSIPNYVAQQVLFQAGVNQGRWNPAEAFGGQQIAEAAKRGEKYFSYGGTQQYINKYLQEHPEIAKEQTLNPYERAREENISAYQRVLDTQKALANRTETVDLFGRSPVAEQRQKEYEAAVQQHKITTSNLQRYDSTGAKRSAQEYEDFFRKTSIPGASFTPTTSNLQFKETVLFPQ